MDNLDLIENKFDSFIQNNKEYIANKKIGIGVSGGQTVCL